LLHISFTNNVEQCQLPFTKDFFNFQMGRSMADRLEILIQSASLTAPTPFSSLLQDQVDQATKGIETKTQFSIADNARRPSAPALFLWVSPILGSSLLSFEEAQIRCSEYLKNVHRTPNSTCITLLRADIFEWAADADYRCILVVLSKAEDALCGALVCGHVEERLADGRTQAGIEDASHKISSWAWLQLCRPWRNGYRIIPAPNKTPSSWKRLILFGCVGTFTAIILTFVLVLIRGRTEDIYDRYITTGSVGPKHQLRIYWQNASEWAAANAQDTGKWKVRIDDQAIIPAELYDEDEENYQHWYRHRYPEMQQVIDNRDYIRPSWMGSLNMMVPWDEQFHFAHCVLALRRYWKAKETGRHVCGRDIDYLHIDHCLSSLENRVFVDGTRKIEDPPTYMYWQTKVCF
jgi:hypothetical protein